jgi:hypothetical protein
MATFARVADPTQIVLSGVTDAYGKGTEFAERVRASTRTINSILRTWTGRCAMPMPSIKAHAGSRITVLLHR